jgi:prolyl-tRNA synthetase
MMKNYITSYKDLPISVYQFQTKLRNEVRAKSGVMRGREFVMKDMYSFSADEASHLAYYEATKPAYMEVFKRLGIGDDTYVTFAAGGAFTKFSHEFQVVCEAGEDVTYINKEKGIAINEEVLNDETLTSLGVTREELTKTNTAEIGNIFNFGQQKATDLGLTTKDATGKEFPVWIGSYGIGVTRLIGVLVEKFADEKGIVWPENIAPFKVHLTALNTDDAAVREWADGIYESLTERGVSVLYDDRDVRTGEKFADSDLLGMPYRVVVSKRSKEEGVHEVVERKTGEVKKVTEAELLGMFTEDEED